ncbi:MAG: acyltransferase [Synergistes sp.]|nr:acyltransferase [Synergistes sp.]
MNSVYSKDIAPTATILDYAVVYRDAVIQDHVVIGEHNVIAKLPTPTASMCKVIDIDSRQTVIGANSKLCSNVTVYSNVCIGENCLLGDNVSIFTDVRIGNNVIISRNVTVNSETVIGNSSRIMDGSHITGRANIGNNVFISAGVFMANDNFFGKFGYTDKCKGATIKDNVSIGVGVMLLPKVTIGANSIIAAGSVVNTDIPENVLAAGNPARVITKLPNGWCKK